MGQRNIANFQQKVLNAKWFKAMLWSQPLCNTLLISTIQWCPIFIWGTEYQLKIRPRIYWILTSGHKNSYKKVNTRIINHALFIKCYWHIHNILREEKNIWNIFNEHQIFMKQSSNSSVHIWKTWPNFTRGFTTSNISWQNITAKIRLEFVNI